VESFLNKKRRRERRRKEERRKRKEAFLAKAVMKQSGESPLLFEGLVAISSFTHTHTLKYMMKTTVFETVSFNHIKFSPLLPLTPAKCILKFNDC
jgi:hypothetical protein